MKWLVSKLILNINLRFSAWFRIGQSVEVDVFLNNIQTVNCLTVFFVFQLLILQNLDTGAWRPAIGRFEVKQ